MRWWHLAVSTSLFLWAAGCRGIPQPDAVHSAAGLPARVPALPASIAASGTPSSAAVGVSATASARTSAPAPAGAPTEMRIPIVMYHVIAPPANAPYAYLYVTPKRFRSEMEGLKDAGYCAITIDAAYRIWTGTQAPPAGCRPLVIRFDDGYSSVFSAAYPVLHAMHWPGTLCQQVQRVDFPGGLTASDIRTLLRAGWDLEDHGYYQPELSLIGLDPARLNRQVAVSRRNLQKRFAAPVHFFCWPLGYYDERSISAAKQAGFEGGLGVASGDAEPGEQGYWRLDAIEASGWLSHTALVARVLRLQQQTPAMPARVYVPAGHGPRVLPRSRVAVQIRAGGRGQRDRGSGRNRAAAARPQSGTPPVNR